MKLNQTWFQTRKIVHDKLVSFHTKVIEEVENRDVWVYLDIKQVFEKVPHCRILWKLEHRIKLRGKMLEWMKDCLKDKEMQSVIRDTFSGYSNGTSWVPQGSVLTPIMFQTYMSDLQCGVI